MPRVGPYGIPFPYDPYPLQEHAMTALRDYLEQIQEGDEAESTSSPSWPHDAATAAATVSPASPSPPPLVPSPMATTSVSGARGFPSRVAVLESPTGTGKSQMLLNSVLSYLFDTVEIAKDVASIPTSTSSSSSSLLAEPPAAAASAAAGESEGKTLACPLPAPTLEEVLRQRQMEEEVARVRQERRARVRGHRRQIRKARKLMHLLHQRANSGGGEDDYTLNQDPLAWYAEQSPATTASFRSDSVLDRHRAVPFSVSSSSSSSSSSLSSASDEDDDDDDAEGHLETALATLIPLRKPKVFFASRTHTQLQQLMEDLQRTDFARLQLRPRQRTMEPKESAASRSAAANWIRPHAGEGPVTTSNSPRSPPPCPPATVPPPPTSSRPQEPQEQQARRLTAVHVAGRQHLCLNESLRRRAGGNNDRLNHYCREAMRFERSKQGRQHRRQQQEYPQLQQRDLEDDKGCVYCVESHLRSLMAYLREEQRSADAADGRASASASASSNGAAPSSVYTMDRLRRLGAELQACPYFATRLLLRGADVVLVPYGYLLDESQRAVLLGGSATNPATASEAAAVFSPFSCRPISADEAGGGGGGVTTDESGSLRDDVAPHGHSSLGAVLYHRRQRVTATEAFRRKRAQHQQQQQQQRDSNSGSAVAAYTRGGAAHASSEKEVDTIWRAMARSAPPSLTGDVLVFDEAHNIADHCRSISSVSVSPWQLQLARKLFETYLERYASRLLTRNKQRLRELIRFLGHLLRFCEHAGDAVPLGDDGDGEGNVPPSTTRPTAVHARVFSFNAFLFDADIDNVDVYAFLTFLVDSQLLIKLQGFVSYTLEAELQQEEEKKRRKAVTTAANTTVNISGTDNSLFSTAGVKRQRSSRIGVGLSNARDEAQRQHQFLESISLPGDKKENADEKLSHPSLAELLSQQLQSAGAAPTAAAMAVAASASAVAPSADPAQLRALSTEALQRVERFLCALYTSDTTTTRVVWMVPPPRHAGSVMRQGTLKVIQLEPGMHTFTPLVMEARAVVLAGGTMQPLAFTCGPLLPPPSPAMTGRDAGGDDPHANFNGRSSAAVAANVIDGGESVKKIDPPLSSGAGCTSSPPCFHLISEGHVVPPSSVQVWALGTGPSGLRMELSQQALGLRSDASSATSDASSQRMGTSSAMSPHAHRMLAEIGSTLLNLARVLPPAGAICFFTSYDLMDATVSVLEHTGYYAQINEVKRIFMETRNGRGTGSGTDCGGGEAMARLLREYQDWICCERDNHSDVACKVELSTTATSPPLCNAAAPQHLPGPPRRGAFLFAVMGGRLSEGINFSDDLGRAVVVLGMPYANPTDVELQMNLQHIVTTRLKTKVDAGRQGTCELAGPVSSSPFTCAEEWGLYMDGMMRTVNQCIGRCIRHAGDYATIILLDARYAERQDVRRRVSAWLQPSMRVAQTFGQCFSGVREFFVGRQRKG